MFARFSYRLKPSDLEAQFRVEGLKRDAGVATGLMLFAILFHLVSLPTDLALLGESGSLHVLWGVRVVSIAVAVVALLLIRRTPGVAFFDNVVFVWAMLLTAGVVHGITLLPADYTMHVAWDVFLALAVYTALPLPLHRQVIVASIVTVGSIVVFWQHKALHQPSALSDLLTAFLCANLLGSYASWELQRWRRREFQALRREADARIDLGKAWLEIRTLRGIIPICANCKKVRTDEGHWQQVEAYVRDHSDAEFSHGICPECAKALYPGLTGEDV